MVKVYRIVKMTGRDCSDLVKEAKHFAQVFFTHGIEVLDPVLIEGVPDVPGPLEALPDETLRKLWARDKWCLREAHVAINCDATMKSVGGEHEQGLMRYGYWKPLVLVYPGVKVPPFIARNEDDLVVSSVKEACKEIKARWGTWATKRLPWRLRMLNRALPRFLGRQLRFLFQ